MCNQSPEVYFVTSLAIQCRQWNYSRATNLFWEIEPVHGCQLHLQLTRRVYWWALSNVATVAMSATDCWPGVLPTILSLSSFMRQFAPSPPFWPASCISFSHLTLVDPTVVLRDFSCAHRFAYFAIDVIICHNFSRACHVTLPRVFLQWMLKCDTLSFIINSWW